MNTETIRETKLELNGILGTRNTRKVMYNTTLRREGDTLVIKYHNTDILTYGDPGTLTIDTEGWHTSTTAKRYREFLPRSWSVRNDRGSWNVFGPTGERVAYRYGEGSYPRIAPMFRVFDGMTIADEPRPRVLNYRSAPDFAKHDADTKQLAADIAAYVAEYSDARILELRALESRGGDCWYCLGLLQAGHINDTEHFRDHIAERYTMISVILNAYNHRGYGPAAPYIFEPSHVRRTINQYLTAVMTDGNGRR